MTFLMLSMIVEVDGRRTGDIDGHCMQRGCRIVRQSPFTFHASKLIVANGTVMP
jgi:hypothetical protein